MKLLVTPRLILRPFSIDDLPSYSAITSDPFVMRFTSFGAPLSPNECRTALEEMIARFSITGYGICAMIERRTKKLIGSCGIKNVDGMNEAEIECLMAHEAWGNGYATESLTEVIRHAFVDLGLDRLAAFIFPDHPRAERVAKKLGMRQISNVIRNGIELVQYEKTNILQRNMQEKQNYFSVVQPLWHR